MLRPYLPSYKTLYCLLLSSAAGSMAMAQLPCTERNIQGAWWEAGAVRSTYEAPPTYVNADNLKSLFPYHGVSAGSSWNFSSDGTYTCSNQRTSGKTTGWYQVEPNGCALKLSSRRRNPMRIVHLDDSCMILWHNNPKTAYLTVYRRPVLRDK